MGHVGFVPRPVADDEAADHQEAAEEPPAKRARMQKASSEESSEVSKTDVEDASQGEPVGQAAPADMKAGAAPRGQ
jgi:hypothetical protein